MKSFIQQELLVGLGPVFGNRVARQFERENKRPIKDRHDIRRGMVKDRYFQLYASINRISQELLWEATNISIDRQLPELIEKARQLSAQANAKLEIPEDFEPPRYVSALDIHCMPGGYCSEVTKDDIAAGVLYDRGVYLYSLGYAGPNNDDMGRSVCNYLKR
ncbi:MAG: class I SAM-dependent methyltransferase, partial [Gammaproteobacteria bacterium]